MKRGILHRLSAGSSLKRPTTPKVDYHRANDDRTVWSATVTHSSIYPSRPRQGTRHIGHAFLEERTLHRRAVPPGSRIQRQAIRRHRHQSVTGRLRGAPHQRTTLSRSIDGRSPAMERGTEMGGIKIGRTSRDDCCLFFLLSQPPRTLSLVGRNRLHEHARLSFACHILDFMVSIIDTETPPRRWY